MLWLSFMYDAELLNVSMTYAFTIFSHVLWPIFIPFSIGLLETVVWRKKIISVFFLMGTVVGLYLLFLTVKYPVTSAIDKNIVYTSPHFYQVFVMTLYITATCISPMFSSNKIINIFGILALLFFIASYWFYTVAFFSVWCFFAAILSAIIYLHFSIKKMRTLGKHNEYFKT